MTARHYQRAQDLYRAQAALMDWTRRRGHCNYLHKGDIGHRLFNGCVDYDPADMMRYWLDEAGEISAFAILGPHWGAFDLQVAPALWLGERHGEIFDACEREILRLARRFGITMKAIVVEAFDCDPAYIAFIEARGLCACDRRHHAEAARSRPVAQGAAARGFPLPAGRGRRRGAAGGRA